MGKIPAMDFMDCSSFRYYGFLTFMTPDFDVTGKLIYAYITYIILMTIYSANNLPYSSLSGVMTGDLADRTSLSQYGLSLQ